MYEIPKELKTDIKLWAVYSSDIPFLLVLLLLTLMFDDFFTGGLLKLEIAYYLLNVLFAFVFISKPIPNISIFKLITHGFLKDIKKIKALDNQQYKKQVTLRESAEGSERSGTRERKVRLGKY